MVTAAAAAAPMMLGKDFASSRDPIVESFRRHDRSGTGTVSRDSMVRLLVRLGFPPDQADLLVDSTEARRADGVRYEEFINWVFSVGSCAESDQETRSSTPTGQSKSFMGRTKSGRHISVRAADGDVHAGDRVLTAVACFGDEVLVPGMVEATLEEGMVLVKFDDGSAWEGPGAFIFIQLDDIHSGFGEEEIL